MAEFASRLLDCLGLPQRQSIREETCVVRKRGDDCYVIKYGQMYESPNLSFSILKELSEMFGTDAIDVDDFALGGCDTCDFGSCYGHEIQIYRPFASVCDLDAVLGKELVLRA